MQRKTLQNSFSISGKGIHSGKNCSVTILPHKSRKGIIFERTDLKANHQVCASLDFVQTDSQRQTILQSQDVRIQTPEHLLASLFAFGITDAKIQIDSEEVPILDGSAKTFWREINIVGTEILHERIEPLEITQRYEIRESGSSIKVSPSDSFSAKISSNFREIGFLEETYTLEDFPQISQARTFCYLSEVELLLKAGLIQGGSLDSAFVIVDSAPTDFLKSQFPKFNFEQDFSRIKIISSEGNNFRIPKEPLAHKFLDLVGDFSLLQIPILAKVEAVSPSHRLNHKILKEIFSNEFQRIQKLRA
ncbi:MAG: hypothetical protein DWQ06_14045 [Calditrichaeota bacterium]|nr:MAG: hypothetical protein DWQ06_14045 [Calditrichota bacterium]